MTASELVTRLSIIWDILEEGKVKETKEELDLLIQEVEALEQSDEN